MTALQGVARIFPCWHVICVYAFYRNNESMHLMNLWIGKRGIYRTLKLALVSFNAMVALPALAIPVTVEYTGSISRINYADCQNLVNGGCTSWVHTSVQSSNFVDGRQVEVGNSVVGGFTYDSEAALTAMSSDGFQAIHLRSVFGTSFQSNQISLPTALTPSVGPGSFSIVNDRPIGSYTVDSFYVSNWFSQGDWFATFNFHLIDLTGLIFDSFAVPLSLELSDMTSSSMNVGFLRRSDGDQLQLYVDLTSINFSLPNEVPEPGTWALVLIGFAAVTGTYSRARRPRQVII